MDFEQARRNMVESQIRPNRVTDERIIGAFLDLPRERFVPEARQTVAYVDEAVSLGGGRHLMEPMAFALLAEEAEIKPGDVVLEIGCGTGFGTAVLARLANTVVGLDDNPAFVEAAGKLLTDLGIDNAVVVEGAMTDGYAKQAPYDVILFSGAVEEVPPAVIDQLSGSGGRLAAILAKGRGLGTGTLIRKFGDSVGETPLFDAGSPVLPGFAKKPAFSF